MLTLKVALGSNLDRSYTAPDFLSALSPAAFLFCARLLGPMLENRQLK